MSSDLSQAVVLFIRLQYQILAFYNYKVTYSTKYNMLILHRIHPIYMLYFNLPRQYTFEINYYQTKLIFEI